MSARPAGFSALQRAEIAEISAASSLLSLNTVSVLFNEPKLLKLTAATEAAAAGVRFSALQRAEIAETFGLDRLRVVQPDVSVLFNEPKLLKWTPTRRWIICCWSFSALQRAEIAERRPLLAPKRIGGGFSALQRAEIAETSARCTQSGYPRVSVLFNEPKLLKADAADAAAGAAAFQCSSTSRNC